MRRPDPFDLVGTTVAGKYAIESVVDEGGFSVIYRAMHVVWNRPVAIKAFKATDSLSDESRDKLLRDFVQEGALLVELSERCSAVCQARDVATLTTSRGDWVPYMVLEWLDGECLASLLFRERQSRTPPRSLAQSMALLEPIANALALAHDKGIAHRDLKPNNFFVLAEKRGDCGIKLLDFGIAKVCRDHVARNATLVEQHRSFTPAYASPEQFSPAYGPTGPWTDVFAMALIMVELMTGREPIEGADLEAMAAEVMSYKVRPTPRTRGAEVSAEVEAIFRTALAVDPRRRFQCVRDFWSALREAAKTSPHRIVSSPPPALDVVSGDIELPRHISRPSHAPTATTLTDRVPPLQSRPRLRRRAAPIAVGVAVMGVGAAMALGAPRIRAMASFAPTTTVAMAMAKAPPAASTSNPSAAPAPSGARSDAAAAPAAANPVCSDGMVLVRASNFFMGSDDGTPDERPAHSVRVSAFCIDRREVTTAAYKACSDRGECKRAARDNDWSGITAGDHRSYDGLCNARDGAARAAHPVNCVDWDMARMYCAARHAELPTEAQWELAARGPDGRRYPWGDDEPTSRRLNACGRECVAWGLAHGVSEHALFSADDGWATTAPVGSFPAGRSPYGLDDVVGNVWEWTSDHFAPYAAEARVDPRGPEQGDTRVIRGGAWNGGDATWLRPSFRNRSQPEARSYGIGFRCAVSATP